MSKQGDNRMSAALLFRTPFNHDSNEWSDQTALKCEDPTKTQQQFKDECNINILYARYLETGEMPQVMDGLTYGNFEGIFDFQTAQNAVVAANAMFTQLPARIKNRFDNNPQKLLEFLSRDENREEAEFLGLVNKPEEPNARGSEEVPHSATQGGKGAARAAPDPDKAPAAKGAKSKAPGDGGTGD